MTQQLMMMMMMMAMLKKQVVEHERLALLRVCASKR